VDRFEIVRTLSQGRLADLFLARERTVVGADRLVALKRLRLKYRSDPDLVQMFRDECRLAICLEHPRIVRAYGIEEWEGSACLVLEFLQGVDAGSLVAAGLVGPALGLEAAVTIAHAAADALDFAHRVAAEVAVAVPRDISPRNLFICRDGSIKLIDLGGVAPSRMARGTPRGSLKGKFAYMSPEQCRHQAADGKSDIFSLGVILYELTTGRRPFRAARASQVVRQIIEQPLVPPRALDPGFPPDLDALVVRMLAKEPERRPATAGEVRDGLVEVARRLGFTLARLETTAAIAELSVVEPIPRRPPSDTLPDARPETDTPLEGALVLVVDDEESFHAVTRKRLQSYRRISAYSALQALDAVSSHAVDVILLDLNLPDRSGLDILEELRALGGDVAVIVCTADASVDLAVQCMKLGATDFLVKTHESFAALGSRIQSALRKRPTPPAGVGTR
jgi:serine/threonine protein kinase